MPLKVFHCADLHLDAPFSLFTPGEADRRRIELRSAFTSAVLFARSNGADIFIISGDLFDGDYVTRDTCELLAGQFASFPTCRFFIAPGNHDPYTPESPYARTPWSDNVHIFTEDRMQTFSFPELGCAVHGAAFTAPECPADRVLSGFRAPEDGLIHIGLLHGDVTGPASRYRPLRTADIAASALDYLALGHVHAAALSAAGDVSYGYCGCPEGRGFDELGDKGFLTGQVERGHAELRFVPFARRRYCIVQADVTDGDPLAALERICFSDPWSENAFRAELDNPGARFTVAQDGAGTVLGYLGLHYVLDEGYIANIAVDPLFRRQGIGSALLDDAADFARQAGLAFLTLEVRQSNLGAQALYRRHGFCPAGVRKNYYRDPVEDAILMTRKLTEEESQK